MYFKESIS